MEPWLFVLAGEKVTQGRHHSWPCDGFIIASSLFQLLRQGGCRSFLFLVSFSSYRVPSLDSCSYHGSASLPDVDSVL